MLQERLVTDRAPGGIVRHRLARFSLIAALTLGLTGLGGALVSTPASADTQLTLIGSHLQYESCRITGELGQRAGWWTVWWCSYVDYSTPAGYELWAYKVV
ncbi:unnamed protein product [[Actinomadura] parvosata subsp. kistnae]|uniref:hypothetical protein n=1 Tax=[Actinomadura] parvosata TaxID=1955412 RepID=UPI000D2B1CAA|nr:unnamed protein product [Actinomadura parvosata subsp. kistnae]